MATRNFSYDHPAYLVPVTKTATIAAGSAAHSAKFVAFTAMLMKSATIMVQTAGTTTAAGANTYTFNKISGTTTTSVGFSGNLGTTVAYTVGTNVVLGGGTATLAQGEMLSAVRGTDATAVAEITYEFLLVPGANLTV